MKKEGKHDDKEVVKEDEEKEENKKKKKHKEKDVDGEKDEEKDKKKKKEKEKERSSCVADYMDSSEGWAWSLFGSYIDHQMTLKIASMNPPPTIGANLNICLWRETPLDALRDCVGARDVWNQIVLNKLQLRVFIEMINVSGYWSSYSIDVATILLYEPWAIFDELTLAWDHGFKQIILESDSGEVVEVTN
ncbi:hypothetical protein PVK06_012754 [Gossypium arboreum]|uniref:RNase H type-1 domain-containing protein n=1 Tax=Gossypium arboreum TaxID=29729 RepID=A0ABR0QDM4_GOSAR|nr:hypothetical protein PVK06_012754 [Gossypium arboreum]